MPTFIQEVYGPLFIGVMLNIMLYGVMFTQTYLYFNMYKDDRTWIKVFVIILFLLDTINTGFDISFVYDPLINRFGDIEALTKVTWIFVSDPVLTAIISVLVQLFFAWRVKVLTSNRLLVSVIVVCSITQFCGGTGTTIALWMVPEFTEFRKWKSIAIVWLGGAALADVLITTTLVWHLRKNRTGMPVTDDLVNKIILPADSGLRLLVHEVTVQTGLITALFAITDLTVYLAMPSGWHMMFNMPLAKLYTNSLMSTLNFRRIWKSASDGRQPLGQHPASGQRPIINANVLRSDGGVEIRNGRAPERIVIDVEQHEMIDVDMKDEHYPSATSFVSDDMNVESPASSV
ncbi:hypothetical protein LXA43DRAFT_1089306 [Ganoderma leucocontextum]|nr:hypothetical protein LXA43DRAFT_1089306 [Ganoderma leucocontextum]